MSGIREIVGTDFTEDQVQTLDELVAWMQSNGIPAANRRSVIRALVVDGLDVFKEEVLDRREKRNR